jgi:hypothetical protein
VGSGPNPNNGGHLVSIFGSGGPVPKLKVKPPNRNNIKEKEQLYEDAIKLKISLNTVKEENIRLKTKIKILENDMSKQERAMEDFISKFQGPSSSSGLPSAAQPAISSSQGN